MAEQKVIFTGVEPASKVFVRSVKGSFRNFKTAMLLLAYSVYFLLPWLRWDRISGPDQAVLFDLDARLFYIFGLVMHPQDVVWLTGFLIIAAYLLFFITGVLGRVWCGYFCFHTLWLDTYMFIERLVQGERPARVRLSKQGWGLEKIAKLSLTFFLYLLVAFVTGFTFVLYWGNAPEMFKGFFHGELDSAAYITTLILTASTFMLAGFAREQLCKAVCPYARFQAAMFDRDTLIIAYDEKRGEADNGRAKPSKENKTRQQRQQNRIGDCVDCGFCVQVCPTGIDIRNGIQNECISCGLCIDACNQIMSNLGWPKGLIRYTSEREVSMGIRPKYFKPKNIGYALAFFGGSFWLAWNMAHQDPMDMSIRKIRKPMYVQLSDGRFQNSYELKVNNKTQNSVDLGLVVEGLKQAEVDLGRLKRLTLKPEQTLTVLVRIKHEAISHSNGQQPFEFVLVPKNIVFDPIRDSALFYTPKY
ncbi:MAG: cytochrome c oxidase accessory protein CcoG [Gammaproteobacteria bacterium]|nr:cytochrome c oxidase accessory protein CcoG [Gammaproteobacteria bacterium]